MNEWFEAEQRIERAQEFSESQRWAEALAELDAALAINPHVAIWHAQRGYLLEELDRAADAVEAYEAAVDLEPDDADMAMALGVVLTRVGRYSRALEVFEKVAASNPDLEPAYCYRISVYTQLGRHEQAEEMFYLAQELDDSCPHCFFNIGLSLAARGQMDRALYCWQRVLELDPMYVGVNRRIAQAYRARGERDLARDYFLRELREDPGNADLLYELGEMAFESGQLHLAGAKFEQILELDPDHEEARFALGKIRLAQGRNAEALTCFEAISAMGGGEPDLPGFELSVGEALFKLGRFAEATERLHIAWEQDPGNVHTLTLLANGLLGSGKTGEAADCFRRLLALDGRNPFAHSSLGACMLRARRYQAGLDRCLEAIRLKPDFGIAMYNAGVAYLRLAKWAEARAMLRRASCHEPVAEDSRLLLRRIGRYRLRHYLRVLWSSIRSLAGQSHR